MASLTEPGLSPAGVGRNLYRWAPGPACFERAFLCLCGLRGAGAHSPAFSSSFSQHLAQASWLPGAPVQDTWHQPVSPDPFSLSGCEPVAHLLQMQVVTEMV